MNVKSDLSKKYAFLDIDGTLYNGYTIKDLVLAQDADGLVVKKYLKDLFHFYELFKKDQLPYEDTANGALKAWGKALSGKSEKVIREHAYTYFKSSHNLFPFAPDLVHMLNKKGFETIIVTGEPQFVGEFFTDYLGAHSFRSSVYEVIDGLYTGKILISLGDKKGKHKILQNITHNFKGSAAFGDSEGDIAMFELVDHPFCINPSENLAKLAHQKNWSIVTEKNIIEKVFQAL